MHLLFDVIRELAGSIMVIRLRNRDLTAGIGTLLSHYQAHFPSNIFLLDTADGEFIEPSASVDSVLSRTINFNTIAGWIIHDPLEVLHGNVKELLLLPPEGAPLLRCEVSGDMSTEAIVSVLSTLRNHNHQSLKSLLEFFNNLPDDSTPKKMLTPFIVPQLQNPPEAGNIYSGSGKRPCVSFITSLFKGGDFLPGYLENIFAVAKEAEGEVIIIDANSADHDGQVVKDFLDRYPTARSTINYMRLDHDPGLYNCWKIGIELARADLVTNANADDRRCPHHTLRLVQILNHHPEYAGACGSLSAVRGGKGSWFALEENEIWFYNEAITEIRFQDLYRTNRRGEVMSRNIMHCMPVWRKKLHAQYGYFEEESYGTSADWAFWLKCAKAGEKFIFEKNAFGRYYINPVSHNRRNDAEGVKELRIIQDYIGISQSTFINQ
jgi:glycosyltransferase involved in cell wall biosynthesis